MSAQSETRRLTAPDIRARKGGEPIVMLTSYHAHTARLVDQHADVILVGIPSAWSCTAWNRPCRSPST